MKNIKLLCLVGWLLTGTTVFAGNGKFKIGSCPIGTVVNEAINDFSACNLNDLQVSTEEDLYGAVSKKNFYPAYSFNVLKKAWYAINNSENGSPPITDFHLTDQNTYA